jgi:hypothetical protein
MERYGLMVGYKRGKNIQLYGNIPVKKVAMEYKLVQPCCNVPWLDSHISPSELPTFGGMSNRSHSIMSSSNLSQKGSLPKSPPSFFSTIPYDVEIFDNNAVF